MKKLEPEGTIQCPNLALGHYDQAPGLQDPKGGSTTLESSEASPCSSCTWEETCHGQEPHSGLTQGHHAQDEARGLGSLRIQNLGEKWSPQHYWATFSLQF